MKFSEKFRSRYLSAPDIKEEQSVVITRVTEEEVGRDRESKVILHFRGIGRPLILNQTNGRRLAKWFGDDMDAWVGKTIILAVETVSFGGEEVDGIRVRQAPQVAQRPLSTSKDPGQHDDLDDAIPFAWAGALLVPLALVLLGTGGIA